MQEMNSEAANAPHGAVRANSDSAGADNQTSDNSGDNVTAPTENGSLSSNDNTSLTPADKYVNKFKDMNDYWWAMDAVNDLASRGIIKGRSETEFDPDSLITRADNTVLLLRVLGKTAAFTDNFDDVYPGKYYYNEIGMAKALGIASGVGDNCFDPDATIRREDMATLAYRVLTREKLLTTIPNTAVLNNFTDSDDIYLCPRSNGGVSIKADGRIRRRNNQA